MLRNGWLIAVLALVAALGCGGADMTDEQTVPTFEAADAKAADDEAAAAKAATAAKLARELPPPPAIAPAEPAEPGRPQQLLLRPLDTGEINRVVRSRANALRVCYDEARLLDPALGGGEASMKWTIEPTGSVAWATLKTADFRSPRLAACLTKVVLGMIFRSSSSRNVVSYPFRFEPPADE